MDERSLYLLEEAILETLESKLTTIETKEELISHVRENRQVNKSFSYKRGCGEDNYRHKHLQSYQ
jgi:hypothetical protein